MSDTTEEIEAVALALAVWDGNTDSYGNWQWESYESQAEAIIEALDSHRAARRLLEGE